MIEPSQKAAPILGGLGARLDGRLSTHTPRPPAPQRQAKCQQRGQDDAEQSRQRRQIYPQQEDGIRQHPPREERGEAQ
jgi:hypothetical protein